MPVVLVTAAAAVLAAGTARVSAQEGWSRSGLQARAMVMQGDYEDAVEFASRVNQTRRADPQVVSAWLDAQMALGQYPEAAELAESAAETFEGYLPTQVEAIGILRATGHGEEAAKRLKALDALAKKTDPKSLNAIELVALGRAARMLGAEPKLVLSQFFDRARQMEKEGWQGVLATAELAIDKADYALAARVLNDARTRVGSLPDILYLQARAVSPSDREKAAAFLDEALELNSRHLPSLLLRAEHAIDFEDYDGALATLAEVRKTNPRHPVAWALEAAIDFILDRESKGQAARKKALEPWAGNPKVDYWIGLKISQMRRFSQGAEFLRRALAADPGHLPSKKALGQDLLRLGREDEGWALIQEVRAADPYDVEIYNLILLHDELAKFETLRSDGFEIRMRPREAAIYGPRVLELLAEARRVLGEKYGFKPVGAVRIDFFPDQQDFAVRTLGIPGGLGILGASFGNVVAMNSPGSPAALGTNWESTLWHEFCHTITLGATDSRIPRWLTEGISVYEERRRDASAAAKMSPEYRQRILADDGLIPISKLSAALTAFSEPDTISFAYYQASLLVEYLVDVHGEDSLRTLLADLRSNGSIEQVMARRMAKIGAIEKGFASYARERAKRLAPEIDWDTPEPDSPLWRDPEGVADYLEEHPASFWALTLRATFLLGERRWEEAKDPARRLIELYPEYGGEGNGYGILATACRNLDETEEERATLRQWAERDGEASEALLRLLDLDLAAEDWEAVDWSARRLLSINPLLRAPHHAIALAAEAREDPDAAIRGFEAELQLDPVNPGDVHFRLGRLYRPRDEGKAKRHVLLAIEEAPRFRAAHALLREMTEPESEETEEAKP